MVQILLAVLAILCSVGVNLGDEAQPHVHHHKVTGQGTHVTRVHRVAQPAIQGGGQTSRALPDQHVHVHKVGGEGKPAEGAGGQGSQGAPQHTKHVHRVTGQMVTHVHHYKVPGDQHVHHTGSKVVTEKTSEPASKVVKKKTSDVYETVSDSSSYEVVYDEISGSYSSSSVYEKSSVVYETISETVSGKSGSVDVIKKVTKAGTPGRRSSYVSIRKNGGDSYSESFGVRKGRRCNRGLIDKTATGIRDTVNGGVGKIMGALSSLTSSGTVLGPVGGFVNAVGHAGGHLIQGKLNEIDYMINDAACGIGNAADAAADMLKTGNIVSGVGHIGKELVGGVGNMGKDFISQAAAGIGNAANDILGFLGG